MPQRIEDDLGAVHVVEPRGRDDGFEADASVRVVGGLAEERDGVRDLVRGVAQDVRGDRARLG